MWKYLANRSLGEMNIELLAVPRSALERDGEGLTVDQDLASNLSVRLSLCENIE